MHVLMSLVASLFCFIFMAASIAFALIMWSVSLLFGCLTLTSACTSLPLSFESLLWFLAFFLSPCSWPFCASRRRSCTETSQALLFCPTGRSFSASYALLLKKELALTFVRFQYFLVYYIHSDKFCLKKIARTNDCCTRKKSRTDLRSELTLLRNEEPTHMRTTGCPSTSRKQNRARRA